MSLNPVEESGMVDTASAVDFRCGCGAGWGLSGLLSSSDLTSFVNSWIQQGHDHDHAQTDGLIRSDAVAEAMDEKAEREANLDGEDDG